MLYYKTSFQGLEIEVKGVYTVYNLTPAELQSFRLRFRNNKINGSGSSYTTFENAQRHVWLRLFIHDCWIPIRFDIRNELLSLTGSNKVFKKVVEKLSKALKDQQIFIPVTYDIRSDTWKFYDKEAFLVELKKILSTF